MKISFKILGTAPILGLFVSKHLVLLVLVRVVPPLGVLLWVKVRVSKSLETPQKLTSEGCRDRIAPFATEILFVGGAGSRAFSPQSSRFRGGLVVPERFQLPLGRIWWHASRCGVGCPLGCGPTRPVSLTGCRPVWSRSRQ